VLSIVSCVIVDAREVGVSYGRVAKDLPDPESVVKLLQESGITTVRLYDADPRVLKAFANTSIKVMVMLPNYEVAAVAVSPPFALQWVQRNVSAHADPRRGRWERGVRGGAGPDAAARPGHGQRAASAGRAGPRRRHQGVHADLVHRAQDTFPLSSARFRDDIAEPVMKPMHY
jgi:hypothetical protein